MSEESAHSSLWSSTKALSSGMAYLVWRSMRGKPQFVHIADTAVYWNANITVFFAVGFFSSWTVLPLHLALFNGVIGTGMIVACAQLVTNKFALSRVPGASAIGAAAGYAALERATYLLVTFFELYALYFLVSFVSLVVTVTVTAVIFKRFKNLPPAIRKPGYKPCAEDSFDESTR